jgi:hypothetical protein
VRFDHAVDGILLHLGLGRLLRRAGSGHKQQNRQEREPTVSEFHFKTS